MQKVSNLFTRSHPAKVLSTSSLSSEKKYGFVLVGPDMNQG